MLKPGDYVIYRQGKHSTHPTQRAVNLRPAPNGDFYSYDVLKYWVVQAIDSNGKAIVITRRGKRRMVDVIDPCLRKASWLERIFNASRFPQWPEIPSSAAKTHAANSPAYQ